MDKLDEHTKKVIAHNNTYSFLPLNEIPNFHLKRPLTEHEMSVLRLIAACETDTKEQYDNWLRSMVLSGHIKNFLKAAKEAEKLGYWERSIYIELESGLIGYDSSVRIPFPPKDKEYS